MTDPNPSNARIRVSADALVLHLQRSPDERVVATLRRIRTEMPTWDAFVDKSVVDQYGFSYDSEKAKADLAAAGYVDTDGDGLVENKDGSKIELSLIVPTGWSDWEESIRSISASAQAAGINVVADTTNGISQSFPGTF